MQDTVIKIEGLKKQYRLGTIGGGTLSADLQAWWAKKRGKEDPRLKIGESAATKGTTFMALDGIDLEVKRGEAVGIIGHNGAGKSTLLKILSRVTAPTEGTVKIKGRIASMLEVGTGFHGELTGRENIYMNGAILGMTKEEVDAKIDDIIEFSECAQFIDTPVKRYSSGMYVKLAFSVAAHLDADIMVMDEVLAVGDVKFQEKCLGKMGDAANTEGRTVLYISHNMSTIRKLCTRCIVLKKGKVIYDGDVEEAIRIYLDFDKTEFKTHYDLKGINRPSAYHGSRFRFTSLDLIEKEEAVYFSDEEIRIRLGWESYDDLSNLHIRMALTDISDGQMIGMTQSETLGATKKGESGETVVSFDISNIVEGKYRFDLDIYTQNEFGTYHSYDHPLQEFAIQIIQAKDLQIVQEKNWGKVRLNQTKVIENRHFLLGGNE